MVTVGCCDPIVEYVYLAIILAFAGGNVVAALKIASLPYRFIVFISCIVFMPLVDDSGIQFPIILFFLALCVLFRAIRDLTAEGGPDV